MEIARGNVEVGLKDEQGQPLTLEAAQHMAQYRIRCNKCGKNWCTKCRAQPYHLGKTCEQNEKKDCRFCLGEVKERRMNDFAAFMNVC